ncbi:hypothetical protein HK096_009580, partial [Nowakowskiella sp. JEL0078]
MSADIQVFNSSALSRPTRPKHNLQKLRTYSPANFDIIADIDGKLDVFPKNDNGCVFTSAKSVRDKDHWSHRHYFTLLPTCNKLLAARWEDHARNLHLQKLKSAKSGIDNSAPKSYSHLELRLKRMQIEE